MAIGEFVPWNPRYKSAAGWITDANGCDIWQGVRRPSGYGQVRDQNRTRHVHCVRYEREIGPIPEGMELDHFACDNGPGGCCNPRHCRPVTRRENSLRGRGPTAMNAAKDRCPYGHPLTGGNLVPWHAKHGGRACLKCKYGYVEANRAAINARRRAAYRRKRLAVR